MGMFKKKKPIPRRTKVALEVQKLLIRERCDIVMMTTETGLLLGVKEQSKIVVENPEVEPILHFQLSDNELIVKK